MIINTFEELQAARQQYKALCRAGADYRRAEVLLKAIQKAERENRNWR